MRGYASWWMRQQNRFEEDNVTPTPSPSRCGRLACIQRGIIGLGALPGSKFVFLKGLSLNSSSDWS
jgi:hypothetical protein